MKTKYLFRNTIVLLLLAFISSCEEDAPDTQEPGLISLSQVSQDYVLNEEEGTIQFTLAVSLSGQDNPQAFSVLVQPNLVLLKQKLDEIEDAVAMPADLYNVPATVEVPDGQKEVDFQLTINRNILIEKYPHLYGKQLAIAVVVARPSRYGIDETHATVAITINSIDVIPKPEEPVEPEGNLLRNGDFGDDSNYWTIVNMGMGGPSPLSIEDGKLRIKGMDNASWAIYQAVQVEAGKTYKLSGEIFNGGFASNNYIWAQFYVHATQPVDGTDYSPNGDMPGWEFGPDPSWSCPLPASGTIGEHKCWGKEEFKATATGTVYVTFKAGGFGGSGYFDLDNLKFEETTSTTPEGPEVPDPEPEPEGNLIKGGDFGPGSEQFWTIINGEDSDGFHENMAVITNGYLAFDYGTDQGGGAVMVYQKIELEKDKRYKLTADFSSNGGATAQDFQLIIDHYEPQERVWYDIYRGDWENEILFLYIDNWQSTGLGNKLKGKLQEIAPWVVNIERPSGEFTAKFSGEGDIILRFGSWDSPGSIIIDNLYLKEM